MRGAGAMQRASWISWVFAGVLTLLWTAACRGEAAPQAEAPSQAPVAGAAAKGKTPKVRYPSSSPAYTNWWLEWSKDQNVGAYDRAGRKNERWDAPARSALE